jgi:hypothetical protein
LELTLEDSPITNGRNSTYVIGDNASTTSVKSSLYEGRPSEPPFPTGSGSGAAYFGRFDFPLNFLSVKTNSC